MSAGNDSFNDNEDKMPSEAELRKEFESKHWVHTSAVMASSPFERRFRDIHTVALQSQGRKNHFQSGGGWLLGNSVNATNMSVI